MPPQIPQKARVLLGSITVLLFLVMAVGFYPAHPVLTAVLGTLALFRFYVLLQQIRRRR